MRPNNQSQQGQSLIELLLAMGVFVLVVSGIMFLTLDAHLANLQGAERTKAALLAQEGAEAAASVHNRGWKYLALGDHGLSDGSGYWELTTTPDGLDKYTRQISIEPVQRDTEGNIVPGGGTTDFDTKKVTSQVTWDFQPNRPSVVAVAAYLTNWKSRRWVQTSQAEFDSGTKDNTVSTNTNGGELTLLPARSFLGNQFLVERTLAVNDMTSQLMKTSLRFTAQASKTTRTLAVHLEREVGASPTYRYGFQGDNAGVPTGVWLGPSNRGYGDSRATRNGWQTVTLTEPVTFEAGTTYHLVVEWQSGQINTNRYIALRASEPLNGLVAFNNTADPRSNVLWSADNGLNWTETAKQPIFQITYTDGSAEGDPYDSSTEFSVFGQRESGELFTIRGGDKEILELSFYLRKNPDPGLPPNPLDDLYVSLEDTASGTLIERGTLASLNSVTATYAWYTYAFTNQITLRDGVRYRVYLSSPGSDNKRYYQVYRLNNPNQAVANAINYDGVNAVYSSSVNGGRSWNSPNNADLGGYRLTTTSGYVLTGMYTSGSFDTQSDSPVHNYFAWTASIPPSTDLLFQLRTADSQSNLESAVWVGPSGTGGDYYTTPGQIVTTAPGASGTRWLEYRAFFTSSGTATSTLFDTTLDYEQ